MRTRNVLCGFLLVCLVGRPVLADQPGQDAAIDVQQVMQMMGGPPGAAGEEPKPFPDFAQVTKGMTSRAGLFTLWFYPPGTPDKDPEKLLCQIPAGFLGEQFMLSTSIAGGGFMTGFPLEEHVVKWELQGVQLILIEPQTSYITDPSKEVSDVVRRTYPERIRAAVPLVTKTPNGDPVIDLGPLLKSDFANVMGMFGGGGGMGLFGMRGGINPLLSKWTGKKTFDLNVEIGVELAISQPSPPGSFGKTRVHFSFWKLPQTDYAPRLADDRVGYFLTSHQDWSKPVDVRDIFNRYIDRWQLVKRDPSLESCEPRQPITFYIEKTVPVRWRRAVRDGILEWNKAFEKCGFVNAVEVRQQTNDNEWKDLDPEDMRYSFLRWIVTGGGFAMGPHRANPFTGQIYDADIVFDDSMVRFYQEDAQRMLPSSLFLEQLNDPALAQFFEQYPQWLKPARPWEQTLVGENDEAQQRAALRRHLQRSGRQCCDYAEGMKHQMQVAQAVLAGQPPEVVERFLYDVVKEVVTHEVGHTLGLRHNFKASSIYTLEEIRKRRTTGEALVGSIMDYNPVLFFAKNPTEGHFITPTIGPYDYWGIEYGYRPFDAARTPGGGESKPPAKAEGGGDKKEGAAAAAATPQPTAPAAAPSPPAGAPDLSKIPKEILDKLPPEARKVLEAGAVQIAVSAGGGPPTSPGGPAAPLFRAPPSGEEAMLREIASRANEPELTYATDEDTTFMGPDPRTNRFDMGSDPVEWARSRFEIIDQRLANVLEWAVKDQESWYHLRSAFLPLLFEKVTVMQYVGRYIGGQYFSRTHRGDPKEPAPFVLVEPERQRVALTFIEENLFSDKFFGLSPEVLNHLAPARWWNEDATVSYTMDFPIQEFIAAVQSETLFERFFPNTLRRIHDAELKTGAKDKMTAAEYLQRLQKSCWADATDAKRLAGGTWSDAAPFLSTVQRSLQREYLGVVEPLVRIKPGELLSPDLHAMLQQSLRELSAGLNAVITANKADFASQAHLVACKSRIDRMLTPELREYEGRSVSIMQLMQSQPGK